MSMEKQGAFPTSAVVWVVQRMQWSTGSATQVVAGFLYKIHTVYKMLLNKQIFIWRDGDNTYFHWHLNLKL